MFVFLGSKTHEMDVLRRKCSAHHAWMDGQADLVLCNHLAFRPPCVDGRPRHLAQLRSRAFRPPCVDGRHLLHSYNFIAWIDGECKNPVQEFSSHSR